MPTEMRRKIQILKFNFVIGVLLAILVAVAGCGSVYRTSSLDAYTQTQNQKFCTSSAGGYALPKGEVAFSIQKVEVPAGSGRFRYRIPEDASNVKIKFSPDASHTYCLDFLRQATSADAIRVKRENGMLKSVFSNVEDKSDEAIEEIAKGIGIAVAAAKGGGLGRGFSNEAGAANADVMQLQFDPFDAEVLTSVNEAMKYTGHCLYIEPDGDPLVPAWMRNQCGMKGSFEVQASKTSPAEVFENSEYEAGSGRLGILYKPLVPHTLVILKRDDPTSGQPWRLWKQIVVEMPNRSPVFLLEVKRGLFTERTTEITFNNGLLDTVKIDKKSELNAASDLVVKLVQIAVQIPAKALIISTSDATNRAKLIETNQALIKLYQDFRKDREAQLNKFNSLTPEQQQQAIEGGADPRSTVLSDVSKEACLQNAVASSMEEAETLCGVK
jgi:hypothetical protein